MQLRIFDVGHGFCAYLVAPNNNVVLFDCGHDDEIGFRSSEYLPASGCSAIEYFVVTNYDGDHLSDLPRLREVLPIRTLTRNQSITPSELEELKLRAGPLRRGIEALFEMMESYTDAPAGGPPPLGEVNLDFFYNDYGDFDDTNNLSLVTFACRPPALRAIVHPRPESSAPPEDSTCGHGMRATAEKLTQR